MTRCCVPFCKGYTAKPGVAEAICRAHWRLAPLRWRKAYQRAADLADRKRQEADIARAARLWRAIKRRVLARAL